jgi:nucleotide-binding universal stress UspA family protein
MPNASTQSTILVAVDGSPESDAAVAWAAHESVLRLAPVTLVHVISPVVVSVPVEPMFRVPDWYEKSASHILRHAERDFQTALAGSPCAGLDLVSDHGSVVPTLGEASKNAQLVVVGRRGLGAIRRLLLGSVSSGLLHHAHCPVAVIHADPGEVRKADAPVVVGIDCSAASEAATALAFDEASLRGVDLVALHAWSDFGIYEMLGDDWHQYERQANELLSESLAGWREKYPDVQVRSRVVCDEPAYWLTEESRRAQLVVLGSHGRGGFTGMLLGSISSTVAQTSSAPVIVVRGGPATPDAKTRVEEP